jgi:hypothetical protein
VGNCNGTLHNTSLNGAMPTSARVSALSIVSDLLRKLDVSIFEEFFVIYFFLYPSLIFLLNIRGEKRQSPHTQS